MLGLGVPSPEAAPLPPPLPPAVVVAVPFGLDFPGVAVAPAATVAVAVFVLSGSLALGAPAALKGGCLRSLGFAPQGDWCCTGCCCCSLRGVVVRGLRGVAAGFCFAGVVAVVDFCLWGVVVVVEQLVVVVVGLLDARVAVGLRPLWAADLALATVVVVVPVIFTFAGENTDGWPSKRGAESGRVLRWR